MIQGSFRSHLGFTFREIKGGPGCEAPGKAGRFGGPPCAPMGVGNDFLQNFRKTWFVILCSGLNESEDRAKIWLSVVFWKIVFLRWTIFWSVDSDNCVCGWRAHLFSWLGIVIYGIRDAATISTICCTNLCNSGVCKTNASALVSKVNIHLRTIRKHMNKLNLSTD